MDFFTQSAELSHKIGERSFEALSLDKIGDFYSSESDYQKAIGNCYNSESDYQKKIDFYNQALLLIREVDNLQETEVQILQKLKSIYSSQGDSQKALEFANQILHLIAPMGELEAIVSQLNDIGYYYEELGEIEKALDYFKQSLHLSRNFGGSIDVGYALRRIVNIYYSLSNDEQKTIDFLNQSLEMYRKSEDGWAEAYTLYYLAFIKRKQGNLEESLNHIEFGLDLIDRFVYFDYEEDAVPDGIKNLKSFYEFYISLLTELHEQHPAAGYDVKARQAIKRMNKVLLNE
jgi:tetratricopeptide (TPR) repeat protein